MRGIHFLPCIPACQAYFSRCFQRLGDVFQRPGLVVPSFHGFEAAATGIINDARHLAGLGINRSFQVHHHVVRRFGSLPFHRVQIETCRMRIKMAVQAESVCLVMGTRWEVKVKVAVKRPYSGAFRVSFKSIGPFAQA